MVVKKNLISFNIFTNFQDWRSCSVGCRFGIGLDKIADATFGEPLYEHTDRILRSMESSEYYIENKIDVARG